MLPFLNSEATAAGCSSASSFGAVELNVPSLPDIRSKILWVRMQSPSSSGKVLAEINSGQCLEIGGTNLLPNQWSWQNSPDGPITFPSFNNNSVKLIGISNGIKIDRILLTEPSCTPKDFGNNCQNAVELKASEGPSATIIPPPSDGAVGGKVILSQTPDKNRSDLESVEYVVEAKIIQTVKGPQPFDTTLIPNGKHSIQINTRLDNGAVIRETTVIDVRNPENALTPVVRWVRLNLRLAKLVALIIGGAIVAAALYNVLKTWYLNYRQRKFHGF